MRNREILTGIGLRRPRLLNSIDPYEINGEGDVERAELLLKLSLDVEVFLLHFADILGNAEFVGPKLEERGAERC